jgi:hypothetical protein
MLFEIKNATIKDVLDVVSGTSQTGNAWTKATVIVEHKDGDYTDSYPMTAFGPEKVQMVQDLVGKPVDVKFDIRARQYNGRWYADVNLRYANALPVQAPAPKPAPATRTAPAPEPPKEDNPDADLPF